MASTKKRTDEALAARFKHLSLGASESAYVEPSLPTGWLSLDACLAGGWPFGGLVELRGRGRSSLALGAVRQAQAAGVAAAWVDGGGGFCPATARLALERLDLLRVPASRSPARSTQALRSADLLLRARAHALVVLDMPPGPAPPASFFRLERLARRARCAVLLLQDHRRCLAGSASPCLLEVNLQITPRAGIWDLGLDAPDLKLRLLRHRAASGARGNAELLLRAEDFECVPQAAPRTHAGS
ncbi:MAG: hypothetical protein DHS20C15_03260 [Planctomycetota bacterium]|nr:MAG: hypothetical protein DHS20C15_03260 [Planctomycetota bacterium]